jgi:capsular exopolysaccharide synthesis family protein
VDNAADATAVTGVVERIRPMFLRSAQGHCVHIAVAPAQSKIEFGLSDIINVFRRRWPLLGLAIGACLAMAIAIIAASTPEYTASAQILFNPQRDRAIGSEGALFENPLDIAALDSQIALIKSRTLLQRVVQQQRLTEDAEFANDTSRGLGGRILSLIIGSSSDHPDQVNMKTVEALRERVTVERTPRTYVATIAVTSQNREKAMRLASAVANTYIADRLATRAAAGERSIRLINPPTTPISPSLRRAALTFALAVLAGLVIGTGIVIAIEVMTVGFTVPQQIEAALGVPVLGMLGKLTPKSAAKRKNRREEGRSTFSDGTGVHIDHLDPLSKLLAEPLSGFSEALRSLQYNIEMTSCEKPVKIIQITSAAPGEGKTTVARCLAASAAAAGLRAVYVDFDLRSPLDPEPHDFNNSAAPIEVFNGMTSWVDALRFDSKTGMHVLRVGAQRNRPTSLLKASQLRNLLERLGAEFDYVVIDSPPLGLVADAAILARMVDKIVLVVKWNATPQEIVQSAVRQLFGNCERVGVVLNFIDQKQALKYDRHAYAQFASKSFQHDNKTDCTIPPFERSSVPLLAALRSLADNVEAKLRPNDAPIRSASVEMLTPAQTGEGGKQPPGAPAL